MDIIDDTNNEDPLRYLKEPDSNDLNRKILVTSMVSLTIVLFLVFSLYLYAKCILARQTRRRARNIHRFTLNVLHVSDAAHHHTESPLPPPNIGLDPTLIASLPIFKAKVLEGTTLMMECVVCLSPLEGDEKVKLLPNCKHFFHVGCIDKWLGSHATCPLCRARVQPRLEPHKREGPISLALHGAPLVLEGSSDDDGGTGDGDGESSKIGGSNSRLNSFRRILSRERSSTRIQPSSHDNDHDDVEGRDLERQ